MWRFAGLFGSLLRRSKPLRSHPGRTSFRLGSTRGERQPCAAREGRDRAPARVSFCPEVGSFQATWGTASSGVPTSCRLRGLLESLQPWIDQVVRPGSSERPLLELPVEVVLATHGGPPTRGRPQAPRSRSARPAGRRAAGARPRRSRRRRPPRTPPHSASRKSPQDAVEAPRSRPPSSPGAAPPSARRLSRPRASRDATRASSPGATVIATLTTGVSERLHARSVGLRGGASTASAVRPMSLVARRDHVPGRSAMKCPIT